MESILGVCGHNLWSQVEIREGSTYRIISLCLPCEKLAPFSSGQEAIYIMIMFPEDNSIVTVETSLDTMVGGRMLFSIAPSSLHKTLVYPRNTVNID